MHDTLTCGRLFWDEAACLQEHWDPSQVHPKLRSPPLLSRRKIPNRIDLTRRLQSPHLTRSRMSAWEGSAACSSIMRTSVGIYAMLSSTLGLWCSFLGR